MDKSEETIKGLEFLKKESLKELGKEFFGVAMKDTETGTINIIPIDSILEILKEE